MALINSSNPPNKFFAHFIITFIIGSIYKINSGNYIMTEDIKLEFITLFVFSCIMGCISILFELYYILYLDSKLSKTK